MIQRSTEPKTSEAVLTRAQLIEAVARMVFYAPPETVRKVLTVQRAPNSFNCDGCFDRGTGQRRRCEISETAGCCSGRPESFGERNRGLDEDFRARRGRRALELDPHCAAAHNDTRGCPEPRLDITKT
jgi:hypothetical protein